jgi:hypothetical protein
MNFLKCIVLGFIAGAIASLTVFEFINWLFLNYWTGWDVEPWSTTPVDLTGIPRVANNALIGGAWGALFGVILGAMPEGMMTFRGAILGLFIPAILVALLAIPTLGGEPVLYGGNVERIVPILCIWAGWGAIAAWLYGLFWYGRLP